MPTKCLQLLEPSSLAYLSQAALMAMQQHLQLGMGGCAGIKGAYEASVSPSRQHRTIRWKRHAGNDTCVQTQGQQEMMKPWQPMLFVMNLHSSLVCCVAAM